MWKHTFRMQRVHQIQHSAPRHHTLRDTGLCDLLACCPPHGWLASEGQLLRAVWEAAWLLQPTGSKGAGAHGSAGATLFTQAPRQPGLHSVHTCLPQQRLHISFILMTLGSLPQGQCKSLVRYFLENGSGESLPLVTGGRVCGCEDKHLWWPHQRTLPPADPQHGQPSRSLRGPSGAGSRRELS